MTPLLPAQLLAKAFGIHSLYFKLEFINSTRSHKDRGAESVVNLCIRAGYYGITVGSCGNYGAAISYYARKLGIKSVIFVPGTFQKSRVEEMKTSGAIIKVVSGMYEDALTASRLYSEKHGIYNANVGGPADNILLNSYGEIALEIDAQLNQTPSSIWVPVGNGTTLAGIYANFKKRRRYPVIYGVGSTGNTAAISSAQAGFVQFLSPENLKITPINEPLVNWNSTHAHLVLDAVKQSGGSAFEVSDQDMIAAAIAVQEYEGLIISPTGAAAIAAIITAPGSVREVNKHVAIITCNNIFDAGKMNNFKHN